MSEWPRTRVGEIRCRAEGDHGLDLRVLERRCPVFVPGIGHLDPDRAGIHVRFARPGAAAGVPGATAFRHQLEGLAIGADEVM
jgi:hypothetical protein